MTTFVVWYGVNILGYSSSLMLLGSMIAAALEIGVLLIGGRLGERFGASRVVIGGGIASAVLTPPSFLLIVSGQPVLVVAGMAIAVCALSFPYAASGTVLTGLFPATTRFTGVAFAQNAAGVLAGFLPLVATALVPLPATIGGRRRCCSP